MSDVMIVGAGPAGLAFARGLAGAGLSVAVIERQPRAALADPPDDGREIALTHRSVATLRALDAWRRIDPAVVAPLRVARVLDGASRFALAFEPGPGAQDRLGQLVANHHLRRALFAAADGQAGLTLHTGAGVAAVERDADGIAVTLADGRRVRARLLVAADARFSATRAALGIAARETRLDRTMLLVRATHDRDHGQVATEWFDYHQTVALLPLAGRCTSVVLTVRPGDAGRIAALDPAALSAELTRRTGGKLGMMRPVGAVHAYPLATVWSTHFAAPHAALIGDAAVGMHPVTAHGFNLGLRSAAALAGLVRHAAARGGDIASPRLLRRYEAGHRLAAGPLFAATAGIVRLYTDAGPVARIARPTLLRVAAGLSPLRAGVAHLLMRH
ncbi:MAG: FAD-dependent hydroxylase [Sphingomonas hengshuiensis]|uniref:FAD-dependent hydroxylase n=2 Tax=Sphingomonas TaxID=13687 RepID=A0A2W4ZGU2_9SPHN|nr:MAG: FAD-dependent hydroxylase [Sphingomonas hengshuiensis]